MSIKIQHFLGSVESQTKAEFMAFSPNGAMTAEQAKIRFQQLVDAFPEKGVGKFCVIERSSGELIGYCGIESFTYQNPLT